jgi:hypothetical protein
MASPCFADEPVEVISSHVDSVSVTIYRDLFALVTETRTVDLPVGAVTLSFEGVVETLIPESAVLADLDRALEERNYDYDALTPSALIEKSIGQSVTITRTLPGSGKVKQDRATIVSAGPQGTVLRTEEGNEALHCSGLPERLTFEEVPAGLHAEPKLSVRLASGTAGKRTIRLSYLAQGFAWSSDYVANLDAAGTRMDLRGWVTLRNFTRTNFRAAQVQMVAGRLHLIDVGNRGSSTLGDTDRFGDPAGLRSAREQRLSNLLEELESDAEARPRLFSECYAIAPPEPRMSRPDIAESFAEDASFDEIIVTGMRRSANVVEREELGDYQLYRVPWATDLNAHQTKQAVFLEKPGVKIERYYGYRFHRGTHRNTEFAPIPASILAFENKRSSRLGEPLPEGTLRLFESTAEGGIFVGEARIDDQAVGARVEKSIANAIDLQFDFQADDGTEQNRDGEEIADFTDVMFSVRNAKQRPVDIEIRQALDEEMPDATIVNSNRRVGRKSGDFAWRFRVPANSAETLSYRLRLPYPDDEDEDEDEEEEETD